MEEVITRLSLDEPGMTPIFKAGLGGLAAALAQLPQLRETGMDWEIGERHITINWGKAGLDKGLKALFAASFRIDSDHMIELVGTQCPGGRPPPEVRSALQDALRQTILQHGKHASKAGSARPHIFSIDEIGHLVQIQPYDGFIHTDPNLAEEIAAAWSKKKIGTIALAGWAHPGAVGRHNAYSDTDLRYTPQQALCACYSITGCLSYQMPGGGILIVLEPKDLRVFAEVRPLLTPMNIREVYRGSAGDALLSVSAAVAVKLVELESGYDDALDGASAVAFRSMPWASQQKSRGRIISHQHFDHALLEHWFNFSEKLPPRLIASKKKDTPSFAIPSGLRAFIAENLSQGRPWYSGFWNAKSASDKDRLIHYRYSDNNKGALRHPHETEGLKKMNETLDERDALLVKAVQSALRNRLGAIADLTKDNPESMKKRMEKERERLRLSFAGAKTPEQTRFALADLWSRAGTVRELREGWEKLLPLLRQDWQAARDLALVALASYSSRHEEVNNNQPASPEDES